MSVAYLAVTFLLAAALLLSAVLKLSGRPRILEAYARVGVSARRLPLLATLLIAGAGGLIIGIAWPPLGSAAAGCLVAYFIAAVAAHIRAGDAGHLGTPAGLALISAAALWLRLVVP